MRIGKMSLLSLLAAVALTSASMVRSETMSVPDAVETKYGFPLFWLHHQTGSIAGPVDIWSAQWLNFATDFVFWFIISAVVLYVLDRYRK